MEDFKKPLWPQIISIVMLLWAFYPDNPYGYYILLRVVLCAAFTYLAVYALSIEKQNWVWILGVTAVIYNPIFRIHLNREIWSVVNLATIVVLVLTFGVFHNRSISNGNINLTHNR